jgi:hypothetical protein
MKLGGYLASLEFKCDKIITIIKAGMMSNSFDFALNVMKDFPAPLPQSV